LADLFHNRPGLSNKDNEKLTKIFLELTAKRGYNTEIISLTKLTNRGGTMKKFTLSVLVLFAVTAASVLAQTVIADDSFASIGAWQTSGGTWRANGSLIQSDTQTGLARINRQIPQSGVYQVEFTVKYSGGGFASPQAAAQGKYHAGFGIHIGVDKAAKTVAWGNGKSYLLWANLDTIVPSGSPHFGLRGQVYQSFTNTRMDLLKDYNVEILPLNAALPALNNLAGKTLPVKLVINTNDGEIRVYDPTVAGYYYYFYLNPGQLKGSWLSLRTNKLSVTFDDFKVTKIR
jgi:hypothetical protein